MPASPLSARRSRVGFPLVVAIGVLAAAALSPFLAGCGGGQNYESAGSAALSRDEPAPSPSPSDNGIVMVEDGRAGTQTIVSPSPSPTP